MAVNFHKGIETASNIAIIFVALVLAGTVANRYFTGTSKPAVASNPLSTGTKIPIADFEFGESARTLVMALSTNCRFCNASLPFYQRLAHVKAGRTDVQLLTIMPQNVEDAKKYLADNSIAVDEVKQTSSSENFLTGTPTLILVDNSGAILQSWKGQLPPEGEAEVLRAVFGT